MKFSLPCFWISRFWFFFFRCDDGDTNMIIINNNNNIMCIVVKRVMQTVWAWKFDEIQPRRHRAKRKKSMKIKNQTINQDGKFVICIFIWCVITYHYIQNEWFLIIIALFLVSCFNYNYRYAAHMRTYHTDIVRKF